MYAYQAQSGVDVRVARIFNTFGPRMNPYDGRVVSNFIIQAIQGESETAERSSFPQSDNVTKLNHQCTYGSQS